MTLKLLLFSFRGRTNRLPFWAVKLILIGWGVAFQQMMGPYGPENPMTIGPVVVTLANFIIVLWIGLAVQIKRWHDRNKSGWWALIRFRSLDRYGYSLNVAFYVVRQEIIALAETLFPRQNNQVVPAFLNLGDVYAKRKENSASY